MHLKIFFDLAHANQSELMQETCQLGYGNVATDYGGAACDPLDEDAATQAFKQLLSDLSATISNKEQAHSAQ